jgi:putative nucleotidyltransferase with HDIG domain
MVQAATIAEKEGASASLITAALLHDIGHLLHNAGEDIADKGVDMQHEKLGADWLQENGFHPSVVEAVRLHVNAKRYLCWAAGEHYYEALSPASKLSLSLQGGPMGEEEARSFIESSYGKDAVALRKWDDLAKIPDYPTPELSHFRSFIAASIL